MSMRVTYTITDFPSSVSQSQGLTAGITINVRRTCALGEASKSWTIASLGAVPTVFAQVATWISADTTAMRNQATIAASNDAIRLAFEALQGDLTFYVDV